MVKPFCCGYLNVHANCCAVTSTRSGSEPARSFRARTTAEMIAIEVTSANGMAVQAISSPVCPWIGAPSASSSGAARNFHAEYTSAAMTIA